MAYAYEEDLNKFTQLCEEVICCKFIVSEIKIMKLLKCIADSEVLYKEMESCLEDFNYEYELQKCKVPDEKGRYRIILPVEATKKVALIFRILYDIDSKNIDIQKFINDYYYDPDEPYDPYTCFCRGLIRPFMENVVYLITGIELIDEPQVVEYDDSELSLSERSVVDIVEMLKKINKLTDGNTFKDGQKEEVIIVTNGLANALLSKSPEFILITWVGFKNTLKDTKAVLPYLKKIEAKLRASGIFNTKAPEKDDKN